jgi:hypothetical protein
LRLFEGSLAEWFYINKLPGWDYLSLVVDAPKGKRWRPTSMLELEGAKRVLVPLGGGKDSLVVQELLSEAGDVDWQWFFLSGSERWEYQTNSCARRIAAISGTIDVFVIDSDLTAMMMAEASASSAAASLGLEKGGFVDVTQPYTAFVAFTAALSCLLTERNYIAVGNERSANADNLIFEGHRINHQYDKSFEFEQAVASYIKQHICPDIVYFSALQHLWDLQVARVFASRCSRYHGVFVSCNEAVDTSIWKTGAERSKTMRAEEAEKKAKKEARKEAGKEAGKLANHRGGSVKETRTGAGRKGEKRATQTSPLQKKTGKSKASALAFDCGEASTVAVNSSDYRNCGECEKCCFVWLVLSAFLPRDETIAIFGSDLYEAAHLGETFAALLGVGGRNTPFECVGTHQECRSAAHLARQKYVMSAVDTVTKLDRTDSLAAADVDDVDEDATLPWFFGKFKETIATGEELAPAILGDFNHKHNIPAWVPLGV